MASALEMVQDVADRVGLVRPSAVVGSNDAQVRALLALLNQEGRELARRFDWQALSKEKTFTTIAAEAQTSALPSDFDRFVTGTFYNRTKATPVAGPVSARVYADYKGRLASLVYDAFRVRGNDILIVPTPAAGETMAYEYISSWWCGGAADTAPSQAAIVQDTDIVFLDEEVMRQGLTWRFQKARGLDYAETYQGYELLIAQLTGRDGGAGTLLMAPDGPYRPYPPQVPDGNWNI